MISDIPTLRSLIAVVDSGSVVEAARACGYSPAAVSRQLARLQARLGTRLLEAHGRGIRPTECGRVLAEEARRLIAEAGRFDEAALALARSAAT